MTPYYFALSARLIVKLGQRIAGIAERTGNMAT